MQCDIPKSHLTHHTGIANIIQRCSVLIIVKRCSVLIAMHHAVVQRDDAADLV